MSVQWPSTQITLGCSDASTTERGGSHIPRPSSIRDESTARQLRYILQRSASDSRCNNSLLSTKLPLSPQKKLGVGVNHGHKPHILSYVDNRDNKIE
ncbi:unnamed protein product [Trichogramma brassicae]|uniref:Uncharacterized protein n=1 Tax=Trichogramma brassicae TaxID=86971 RepID=A0A6H5I892_9HYME|nr:unnamed protein product [Trichogramma brassicae]